MRLLKQVGAFAIGIAVSLRLGAGVPHIVVVVSAKNSVAVLSSRQVTDIFLGQANRFPDGSLAVPIDQEEGSPARDAFYTAIAGDSATQIKAHWSRVIFTGRGQPPKHVANSAEVKRLVAGDARAIGYIEAAYVDGSLRVIAIR